MSRSPYSLDPPQTVSLKRNEATFAILPRHSITIELADLTRPTNARVFAGGYVGSAINGRASNDGEIRRVAATDGEPMPYRSLLKTSVFFREHARAIGERPIAGTDISRSRCIQSLTLHREGVAEGAVDGAFDVLAPCVRVCPRSTYYDYL